MELSPYIKQFIEKHIDLIDVNKYEDLYGCWCEELPPDSYELFHSVYEVLLSCGIDMLLYMDCIPNDFFCGYETPELIIPDNIVTLYYNAFRSCVFHSLVLPPSIKQVEGDIFEDACINEVKWVGSPKMHYNAFRGLEDGSVVEFSINKDSSIDLALKEFEHPPFEVIYI